jgi:hypothetical protein
MTLWLATQLVQTALLLTMASLVYQMRGRLPRPVLSAFRVAIALFGVLEIIEWIIR